MTMSETTLTHGDCLERLQRIDSKSVGIVFYDPPYNIKKKYDGYDDNRTPEEYRQWMQDVYNELDRVARKGVIVYIGGKLVRMFGEIFPDTAHLIIVHKRAAGVFSGNYMLQHHAMYSTVKPAIKCKDLWDDVRLPGEGYFFRETRYDHPGLTGLSLTEKVLRHFTLADDLVLDPFMGVGTTGVACRRMRRGFIGIEQSEKYIAIAQARIDAEDEQLELFDRGVSIKEQPSLIVKSDLRRSKKKEALAV